MSERYQEKALRAVARTVQQRAQVIVHLRAWILVHDRAKGGSKCPCCGSPHAHVVETIPGPQVLINTSTGDRINRDDAADVRVFDDLASTVRTYDLQFRCYRKQLEILMDTEHKAIGVFGGNRAGKTAVGITWIALRWLQKAGRGASFWLVAPSREQTHILMRKLILGEWTSQWMPPVFPTMDDGTPLLAKYWPKSTRAEKQWVEMADGSMFVLHHASRKGDNLKGKTAQAILLDEGTEVRHRENWTILLARTVESQGQILVPTTPMPGHWLKEEIVDKVDAAGEDAKHLAYYTLSQEDNPWVPRDEVRKLVEMTSDKATVRREIFGEWVGNKGKLWSYFDVDRHVVHGDGYDVEDYVEGSKNLTRVVQLKHWAGHNPFVRHTLTKDPRYVAGQDFNTTYMAVVIGQVFEFPDGRRGLFVVDEVILRHATAYKMGKWLGGLRSKRTRMRSYPNVPIACDPNGAYYAVHQVKSDRHSTTDAYEMSSCGFDCRPCRVNPNTGNPQAPPVHDSVSLTQKLLREGRLLVHSRCAELIHSFQSQEDDGRGRPVKQSGTYTDRISGPTDALRYLVWPIFSTEIAKTGRGLVQIESSPMLG